MPIALGTSRIALKKIDLDSLDESEDNHEAVEFDILLSETPDVKWTEEFEIAYRTLPNPIKPPVHVHDDRLRVAYLPRYESDLPDYLEYLATVVRTSNEEVRKTEAIARHEHRSEHVDKFRDVLRRIRVSG